METKLTVYSRCELKTERMSYLGYRPSTDSHQALLLQFIPCHIHIIYLCLYLRCVFLGLPIFLLSYGFFTVGNNTLLFLLFPQFCIIIPDNLAIDEQIKKALEGVRSFPVKDQSICVEILLVTNDGDQMFLEAWDLSFNLSSLDMSANKIQHIFTRMGESQTVCWLLV